MEMNAYSVVGILGNIVSIGLFQAPLRMIIPILKKKSVGAQKPYPCIFAWINCLYYILYAFHKRENRTGFYTLLSINVFGLLVEAAYISVFTLFGQHSLRIRIMVVAMIGLVTVMFMAGVPALLQTKDDMRAVLLGVGCVGSGVAMYGSILPDTLKMRRTKSVRSMPLLILVVGLINTAIWLTYSLLHLDIYILVQNSVGLLLNLGQIALYCCYCGNDNAEDECVQLEEV